MSADFFDFPEGHTPRRGRLMASGIILALLGCGFGLLSALYLFVIRMLISGISASAPPGAFDGATNPETTMNMMANIMTMAGLFFGVVAITFLATGIGSIFLKRWSRPLALFLSSIWLYLGCLYLIWTLMTSSGMRQAMSEEFAKASAGGGAMPPDAAFGFIIAFTLTFIFLFGVCLPALVLWLNWNQDVKVTLEFCDRAHRWTDRCPAPVLGIALAAVAMALGCLFVLGFPWFAFFGVMLEGNAARISALALSAVFLAAAWGIYRQKLVAWAVILVLTITIGVSANLSGLETETYRKMYQSMGMDEAMIEQSLRSLEIYLKPALFRVAMSITFIPMIAYLIWALRFFKESNPRVTDL